MLPPVAIVWRCALSVDEYVAAGKAVEVPRRGCPDCGELLRFRSGYWRQVRSEGGTGRPVWVRRAQCRPCRRSHALLPSFLLHQRLDTVEDIGAVVEAVVNGVTVATRAALERDVPYTTARDWVRRFSARAPVLAAGFAALAVEAGGDSTVAALAAGAERRALEALRAACAALAASSLSLWAFASAVTGGTLLATTTHPPWTVLGGRRFMPPVP